MGNRDNPSNILGVDNADNQFASTNVAANADGSIIERLEHIKDAVAAVGATPGNFVWGVAPAGTNSTTAVVIAALAGYGDDFFNNQYYMQILHNDNSAGNAPEKEVRQITDYVSATGTFTVTAFSAAVEENDICLIVHESIVAIGRDDANNTYASTAVVANADGSILERLEYIQGLVGGTDGASNILGANDADNGFDSSTVVANADGSIVERIEYVQGLVGGVDGAANVLGANDADNQFDSGTVAANEDGSILERLEQLQEAVNKGSGTALGANRSIVDEVKGAALNYNSINYVAVPITFAAGTTGAVATHEILTVTGAVRLRMFIECTENVAGGGSIQLGVAGATDGFIGATTGTDIDAGDVWFDTSPAETYGNFSSLVLDKVIAGGLDVGYEVTADTLTGGVVTFHCWWEALNATGAVVAADGTGTL